MLSKSIFSKCVVNQQFRIVSRLFSGQNSSSADSFRNEHSIVLKGNLAQSEEFEPMTDFESTPFLAQLKKVLLTEGFTQPTAIQAQSWPIILANRDVISVARTGSGKTCGFLLPAIHKLVVEKSSEVKPKVSASSSSSQRKPFLRSGKSVAVPGVLVLAPTRELSVQIESEALKYCRATGLKSVCLYGGASKNPQINQLQKGVDVVVATPGRCNDLLEMGELNLGEIKYLVLDEADRMYDNIAPHFSN